MTRRSQTRTKTFLFTDIEGSSRLWERDAQGMQRALARHDALSRRVVNHADGTLVKTTGDGILATFDDPVKAVDAAIGLQLGMNERNADSGPELAIRCGLHVGVAEHRDGDVFGSSVWRAARIMGAAHGGQALSSQALAELIRDQLPQAVCLIDLGLHRLRDFARPERLFQIGHPQLRRTFPPASALDLRPGNLPAQVTSFVGREDDRSALRHMIAANRMVTLVGPGGIGKSRLSIEVGADLIDVSPDGIWWVDLGSLTAGSEVARAAAAALGLDPATDGPAETAAHLRGKRALIVLDNCEHLIPACAAFADVLLQSCPQIAVLATSREALGVRGEATFRVGPLALPESTEGLDPAAAARYSAVRLFVDRASAATGHFELTCDNARVVVEICRRLDGLALAIELAASRLTVLKPSQLLPRLGQRLRLLSAGPRTAPVRQQTLRAALDWSFDRLSDLEKTLLRRLSVFERCWTLEEAIEVASCGLLPESAIFDLHASLAAKSLVVVDLEGRAPQYSLLESMRLYALEKLSEANEETWHLRRTACAAHAAGRWNGEERRASLCRP